MRCLKITLFKDFNNRSLLPHATELEMFRSTVKEFLLPKLREANAKEKAEILQAIRYFLQNNNVLLVKH